MACIENIPPANADSEMEEGEIVDEFDDISSDEELLLRERLHVLETYNNVLERKKANNYSIAPGNRDTNDLSRDLSDISASELEDGTAYIIHNKGSKVKSKHLKAHYKQKRRNEPIPAKVSVRNKDYKKKKAIKNKKLEIKIISESSEESDDEYRNKRRKLANAVSFNKVKNDTSSLSARLKKMLYGTQGEEATKIISTVDKQTETDAHIKPVDISNSIETNIDEPSKKVDVENVMLKSSPAECLKKVVDSPDVCELIDLCNDDVMIIDDEHSQNTVDTILASVENNNCADENNCDSDEDLELLRQHALKTKSTKLKTSQIEITNKPEKPIDIPQDEDSYTADDLRIICLKSAYLKKAFEIKRKKKLRKRLSQSSTLQDDLFLDPTILSNKVDSQNNTDIESVDMEIGSDGDEKFKDFGNDCKNNNLVNDLTLINKEKHKEDELDEDEDLLRAKLLTSLSKNLLDPNILDAMHEVTTKPNKTQPIEISKETQKVPPKKFIIQLGESDSEGEHEATKNLTKMHIKQQQTSFEQQLDMFLKCTRMEVEKQQQSNDMEQQTKQPNEKFVPKSVKHLPKSEQIEYKNLVKRMAELEKMKQARQTSINALEKTNIQLKETLKPRNVTIEAKVDANTKLDERIAKSRKKIAEESMNINKLKEEGTKLSRKYKIVATELKNIATAIAINKKQQRAVHLRLTKIRAQHQMLLKSSTFSQSQTNGFVTSLNRATNKIVTVTKLQKENDPTKEEYKNPNMLKSMKISVVNDLKEDLPNPRLSIQVDVSSNKKVVKVPKSPMKDKHVDISVKLKDSNLRDQIKDNLDLRDARPLVEKGGGRKRSITENMQDPSVDKKTRTGGDDYKSPLDAFGNVNWEEDLNAVLCPFEVGGNCKDPDCKYLHPKTPSIQ